MNNQNKQQSSSQRDRQRNRQTNIQINKQTDRQSNKQINNQRDRQNNRQISKQNDRQNGKKINKRIIGSQYEQKAVAFLEEKGFVLLETNFRIRQGEIDIVGLDEEMLVFVEVKFRKNAGIKNAMESVTLRKQRQICKVSLFYINYHKEHFMRQIRYDVVAMNEEEICWIKNAFPFCS